MKEIEENNFRLRRDSYSCFKDSIVRAQLPTELRGRRDRVRQILDGPTFCRQASVYCEDHQCEMQ